MNFVLGILVLTYQSSLVEIISRVRVQQFPIVNYLLIYIYALTAYVQMNFFKPTVMFRIVAQRGVNVLYALFFERLYR